MDFVLGLVSVVAVGLVIGIVIALFVVRSSHSYHAPNDEDYIKGAVRSDNGTYAFAKKGEVYRSGGNKLYDKLLKM
ncbi:MAG: hypothetical protein II699_03670 [Lachnospiraceae bacterium]|nr:hypothetical protein [Lachnospiraceae bacterium]